MPTSIPTALLDRGTGSVTSRAVWIGRGLVQVVAASIADAGMDALDAGLGLLPVATELQERTPAAMI
ncbi:hypothetical protein [Paraburkholderia hospita]|jgi:hypothetical protein|uniref:hypothetical protein n=1 Tax=Paraburkholderia hospita TaxID=169430 RepID=UPI003F4FB923